MEIEREAGIRNRKKEREGGREGGGKAMREEGRQ